MMGKRIATVLLSLLLLAGFAFPSAASSLSNIRDNTPTPGVSVEGVATPNLVKPVTPASTPDFSHTPPKAQTDKKESIVGSLKDKTLLSKAEKKLDSQLLPLVNEAFIPQGKTKSDLISEMKSGRQISSQIIKNGVDKGKTALGVNVYVQLKNGFSIDEIKPYVLLIQNRDNKNHLAACVVDVNRLDELAMLEAVMNINTVWEPVFNQGSALSTGDSLLRAAALRSQYGLTGNGIKIGVISDGVMHLGDSVASGDLPNSVNVLSNTLGGDEGTAMLEIVHDLAPGATLYFHDAGTNWIAFNEAIDELIASGCNIIVDDVAWLTVPYFEDGIIASHVAEKIASNNILYVTAAGNAAETHYQGVFRNNGDGWNDFSQGAGLDDCLIIAIPAYSRVKVCLQWNEHMLSATSDYDLYLFDYYTLTKLTSSVITQSGAENPIELISYYNASSSTVYAYVDVDAYNAPTPKTIELFITGPITIMTDNATPGDTIFGHAAVASVVTCGAANAATYDLIADYSSQGPVTMLSDTRQKPDVIGIDDVDITGAGGFSDPFGGTSAAAPHVAAVAALLMQRFPLKTASEIRAVLVGNTVDLGAVGYDTVYGYGRVDALKAAQSYMCVHFDSQGGTSVVDFYATKDGLATLPAWPSKSGMACVGWYKEVSCTNAWNFTTDTVANDTTLYARWVDAVPVGISCTKSDATTYGGNNGSITITASGGNSGAYQYSINGGASWQDIGAFSGLYATTYSAVVRDAHNSINTASASVTIAQPPLSGTYSAKKIPTKGFAGSAIVITPPAPPRNYTMISTSYSSSNPSVASVDANGNVTYLAGGKAKITIIQVCQTISRGRTITKTIRFTKSITVKQPVASITLNATETSIMRTKSVKLAPIIAPSTASNKKVKWTSSNKKVAAVSSSGVVSGKVVGTAVITCTAADGSRVFATCTITVTPIYPTGVKVSKAALSVVAGKTSTLRATVLPRNTDFKTVTWESAETAIAVVDAKGKVTGIAPGIVAITCTTSNGLKAVCTVTVK